MASITAVPTLNEPPQPKNWNTPPLPSGPRDSPWQAKHCSSLPFQPPCRAQLTSSDPQQAPTDSSPTSNDTQLISNRLLWPSIVVTGWSTCHRATVSRPTRLRALCGLPMFVCGGCSASTQYVGPRSVGPPACGVQCRSRVAYQALLLVMLQVAGAAVSGRNGGVTSSGRVG